jgi:alkanesulfonate monooxygenase SsuD/methylene tetrahydromethanopterin reductase-like flavin-dependent oxidoreductase (luciferase family)
MICAMSRRGIALFAGTEVEVIAETARVSETLGYSSFWLNHPGATDGVARLAYAARATTGIALGVGVVPLHTRTAESVIETVRSERLPRERLLLGIGSAGPGAFRVAREGAALLKQELGCSVVMGALSPAACRLAGEIADGVLFNWLTPEYARRSAAWVEEGAQRAGRKRPQLYAYVRVAYGRGARARIEEEGERYAGGSYGGHFARMGVKPLETALAVSDPDALTAGLDRWDDIVDEVVLRLLPASGELDAHLELIHAGSR